MLKKECIAMVLAGGMGTRLSSLTTTLTKPAVPFGVKHRLIDFTLSNCANSGIETVEVLMPPTPFEICEQIFCHTNEHSTKTMVLPLSPNGGQPYKGTADAIYANISSIEKYNPDIVLILSGDHIYKMDYRALIHYHKEKQAAATIAVIGVPWKEASRFGIMNTSTDGRIQGFIEKPQHPQSNLASMGVYVFQWPTLREYLMRDAANPASSHDFGKDIIPRLLSQSVSLYAYPFNGYWKDVGTVDSLYKAHMELLGEKPAFSLYDEKWPIHSTSNEYGGGIIVDTQKNTLFHESCIAHGRVERSILFPHVRVGRNAIVRNSVILPGTVISEGAHIESAIIGHGSIIEKGYSLRGGVNGMPPLAVVGENSTLSTKPLTWANAKVH